MVDQLSSLNKEAKRAKGRISSALEAPIRTGKTAATRAATEEVASAKQTAALDLAESTDEVARRKALAQGRTSGRGSLIKSASSGLSTNLGGT